jgi:hypothetical protein
VKKLKHAALHDCPIQFISQSLSFPHKEELKTEEEEKVEYLFQAFYNARLFFFQALFIVIFVVSCIVRKLL